jgi:hypothetical protein
LAKGEDAMVPVSYADLSEAEERKALAMLDSLTMLADTDFEAMMRNLSQIDQADTQSDLAALFDDLEVEASDALSTKEKLETEGNSNFGSIKKTFRERKVVIKAIYALEDAELIERALEATGKINRAEAIKVLAQNYMDLHNVQASGSAGIDDLAFEESEDDREVA